MKVLARSHQRLLQDPPRRVAPIGQTRRGPPFSHNLALRVRSSGRTLRWLSPFLGRPVPTRLRDVTPRCDFTSRRVASRRVADDVTPLDPFCLWTANDATRGDGNVRPVGATCVGAVH